MDRPPDRTRQNTDAIASGFAGLGVQRLILALAYVALVCVLFGAMLEVGTLGREPREQLAQLALGEAHRPFQLRVLVPWLARSLAHVIPGAAVRALPSAFAPAIARAGGGGLGVSVLTLLAASLAGFVGAFHVLLRRSVADLEPMSAHAYTFLAALGLVPFLFWSHPYDLPTLLLFTLAALAQLGGRRDLFGVVFVLACLNKETAVLLLVPALLDRRLPEGRSRFVGSLALVYVATQFGLRMLYRHNAGTAIEVHLAENVRAAASMPLSIVVTAVLFGGVALRARAAWPRLDAALRGPMLALIPLFAAYLLFGVWGEVRVFLEAYPATCVVLARRSPGRRIKPSLPP